MSTQQQWLPLLVQCLQTHARVVRVVIAAVRGSAPREAGACMLIAPDAVYGTIGGGRLEWEALSSARALLGAGGAQVWLRKFVLGLELGQCCGGAVEIWFEQYTQADVDWLMQVELRCRGEPLELCSTWSVGEPVQRTLVPTERQRWRDGARAVLRAEVPGTVTLRELLAAPLALYVYGAGHVGSAVVKIAAELPWQVTCIDSRAEWLHRVRHANASTMCAPEPVATVAQVAANGYFLVMTHSHALDYALVRALLDREVGWLGLIGSHSKSVRFRAQLRRDGVATASVARLVCPIGIGISDKHPTAIAVSVIAQLLQHCQRVPAATSEVATADAACAASCGECVSGGAVSS